MLTADQVDSRTGGDRVDAALAILRPLPTLLPFTRTVGDELQGLLTDPLSVAHAILALMRAGDWHIGIGVGPVEGSLPADSRAARGPVFVAARAAVEDAKREPSRLRVVAVPPAEQAGHDAEVVLHLLAAVLDRRTAEGWAAVDLVRAGRTQAQAAVQLGVSRQAVGQRLQAAHWTLEREALPVVARLLERSESIAGRSEP